MARINFINENQDTAFDLMDELSAGHRQHGSIEVTSIRHSFRAGRFHLFSFTVYLLFTHFQFVLIRFFYLSVSVF